MAYNLCSSPSTIHKPPCSSLPKPRNFNCQCYFKLPCLSPQPKTSLLLTSVSVSSQEAIQYENLQHPDAKSGSSPKPSIWVNPKSSRASKLKQNSFAARYASLVQMSESLNSCDPIEQEVFSILSGLGNAILEQDAVVIINNMSNPTTAVFALKFFLERLKFSREVIIYNVTMKVFRKSKDLNGTERLFGEMLERGVKPDNVTFSTIISCARISNLPDKAVQWFEKMSDFGLSPDDVTYSTVVDAYGRVGNIEMALSLYDRARAEKWRLDVVTFSTLIKIYGMSGNFDGCLNVFEEMKALGVKPNLVIYNTLIDGMGRAKRPWQAKKIYHEMIDSGYYPSFPTYAGLLRAYSRARYGEDALRVYKEMKEKSMELNVVLYNTILAMCADLGYVDEALEIFEDIKSSTTSPDSWTFSSMITIFSCSGKVSETEKMFNEMMEAGFEPNIFTLTSLIQCYGKAQLIDDVVKTFDRLCELNIIPDERFCVCLLNVMTQTPKEELGKLIECIERANPKLGYVIKPLVEEQGCEKFKEEAAELIDSIGANVRKAFCNCLIDICVNLDLLERACELLDLALSLEIYTGLQSRSPTQWSLHLKSLSLGAALTALHVWINDLSKVAESGEDLPPLLAINTGHGKHKYSDKGLASTVETHLKELNAPFHEAPDKVGWFLTTKVAAESWLESRRSSNTS